MPRVVLGREDEHAVRPISDLRGVGERVALDGRRRRRPRTRPRPCRPGSCPSRCRASIGSRRRRRRRSARRRVHSDVAAGPGGAAVDPVLERDGAEAPPRQHLDRLRVAVRDREAEVAQRVVGLLRIDFADSRDRTASSCCRGARPALPGSGATWRGRIANGRFFSNSAWMSASSSGKTKPQPSHPSASSGVQPSVPVFACA